MGTPARGRGRIRRILGWIELGLLVLVVGFWFFALRPQGLGGPASYALVSGTSMLPKYHTGDIVIVHHHARYRVGDIVAYKVPKGQVGAGAEVIHRIVGGSAGAGWIMQGDNRTAPDIWHPKNDLIVGRAWVHIAKAGIVIKLLHTPLFLGGLAALVAMLSVLFHKPKRARGPKGDAEPVADPTLPAAGDDPPSWVTHARVDRVPHRVAAAPAEPEPAPAHEPARPLEPNPATWPFWEFRVGPEHRYAEYELAPAYREPEPGLDFAELERELHEAVDSGADLGETVRELAAAIGEYGRHLQSHTAVMTNLAETTGDLRGTTGELREFLAALTELLARLARES